jgi:hypothetical protein
MCDCVAVVKKNTNIISSMTLLHDPPRNRPMKDHQRREANGEAHSLARLATSLDVGRHLWLVDPLNLFVYS